MKRILRWMGAGRFLLAVSVTTMSAWTTPMPVFAGLSPEARCESRKEKALGNRAVCRARQRSEAAKGRPTNFDRCEMQFRKAIAAADKGAARKGTRCRWKVSPVGTARDLDTGLEWTLPVDGFSVRSRNRTFQWSREEGSGTDGSLFTVFLTTLNRRVGFLGADPTCFAGHCDWRIPSLDEFSSIFYTCGSELNCEEPQPVLDQSVYYWTSSRQNSEASFMVRVPVANFSYDVLLFTTQAHAVAVRGEE
jgi:hypothetical protein